MAKIESWFNCDLQHVVQVQALNGNVFSMDNNGNRIGVKIFENGQPATVTGTVTGRCILADDSTVNVNGSLETTDGQSLCYIDIPQGVLLVPGTLKISMQLTDSGTITTLLAIVTTVYTTKTDNVITPSQQIISDWNAEISAAIAGQNATIANQGQQISDLKSALTQEAIALSAFADHCGYTIPSAYIEQGGFNTQTGAKIIESHRIRLANMIPVQEGTTFTFKPGTYCTHISTRFYGLDGATQTSANSWTTGNPTPAPSDGFFSFMLKTGDGTATLNPSQYDAEIKIFTNLYSIGKSIYSQNKAQRYIQTDVVGNTGDKIFVQLLKWGGGSFTTANVNMVKNGSSVGSIGSMSAVGDTVVGTITEDGIEGISVALNANVPSSPVDMVVAVINLTNPITSIQALQTQISKNKSNINHCLWTPQSTTVNYSQLSDANNAPTNTILAIVNNSSPYIANLPKTSGTLVTFDYTLTDNANFKSQLYFADDTNLYWRNKLHSAWNNWKSTNPNFNVMSVVPQSSKTIKIALLGDSITQGQGSTGFVRYDYGGYNVRGNGPDYPDAGADYQVGDLLGTDDASNPKRKWYVAIDGNGWGQKLKAYFESKFNCEVSNLGMAGIDSSYLKNHAIPDNVIGEDYDICILMIGANDRFSTTLATYYSNFKSACQSLLADGKQVVLIAETPVSVANDADPIRNFHMEGVERVTMKVASEFNLQFINLYNEIMDYCLYTGVTIDSLLADGLHPNDTGYEVMFNIITKHLGLSAKRPGATW
jgi:lysophospholipase L1-like esterase